MNEFNEIFIIIVHCFICTERTIMKKISVIVPVFNLENQLNYSIPSILNQTYTNLEVILINDGSTDDSLAICMEFQDKDKRVIVLNQKNQGQSTARNLGLEVASGEYYSFIDGDDMIHPQMYEILISQEKKFKNEIIACKTEEVTNLEEVFFKEIPIISDNDVRSYSKEEYIDLLVQQKYARLEMWDKLIPRGLMENVKFPEGIVHEEVSVIREIIKGADGYTYVNIPLHRYLLSREGNTTSKPFTRKRLEVHYTFRDWLIELKDKNKNNYKSLLQFCLNFTYGQMVLAVKKNSSLDIVNELSNRYNYYLDETASISFEYRFRDKIFKLLKYQHRDAIIVIIKIRNFLLRNKEN